MSTENNLEYFNDVYDEVLECTAVASLVMNLAQKLYAHHGGKFSLDATLHVLTEITATNLNYRETKNRHQDRTEELKAQVEKQRQIEDMKRMAEEGRRKFYANNPTADNGTGY